ncbi:MAG TPA: ComEC/Rec2 family competence protein, partial [Thermoleophilaceae bacterium]
MPPGILPAPAAHAAPAATGLAAIVAVAAVAGLVIGSARIASIDQTAERALVSERFEGRAILPQRPRRTRFGSWAFVELAAGPANGSRVVARAGEGLGWPSHGEPGIELFVAGSIERPRRTPGSRLDWPAYLKRRGVAAELDLDALRPTGGRRGGVRGWIDGIRRRAERGIVAGVAPDRAEVARGMVLGQDEMIDPLVVDDFRRSGLGHLLAVSGQNVVLLCALAIPLIAALGGGIRARVAVLSVLVLLYVLVAGAGPSLQRAAAMAVVGLAALAVGRARSRWYALLLAAAITLAVDPRAAAEPGWQLSFAAVAGILLLAPPLSRTLRALPRPLADGAAMTLAATVATGPIAAHHFEAVSLAGLVANLAALAVVAPIVWLGMVQAALGIAAGAVPGELPALDALAMRAAELLGHVNDAFVGALIRIATEFAALPGAQLRLPLASPVRVIAAYAVPALAWLALRALIRADAGSWAKLGVKYDQKMAQVGPGPRTRKGLARAARATHATRAGLVAVDATARAAAAAWRRAALPKRAAAVALVAAGVALLWQHAAGPAAPPDRLTVSFLDVGQGDATLIQDGHGAAVLFDGGPPEARTYRLLRRAGVRRLALVVATHASRDHHGGLAEVLRRIPTQALLDGGDGTRDPSFAQMLEEARRRGVRH